MTIREEEKGTKKEQMGKQGIGTETKREGKEMMEENEQETRTGNVRERKRS